MTFSNNIKEKKIKQKREAINIKKKIYKVPEIFIHTYTAYKNTVFKSLFAVYELCINLCMKKMPSDSFIHTHCPPFPVPKIYTIKGHVPPPLCSDENSAIFARSLIAPAIQRLKNVEKFCRLCYKIPATFPNIPLLKVATRP